MRELALRPRSGVPLTVVCLGAHPDDIEIGCGGLIPDVVKTHPSLRVHWIVFSGDSTREREAVSSARSFLRGAKEAQIVVHHFRDGLFPSEIAEIKSTFEALRRAVSDPDLALTHYRDDRHQDHRV